MFSESAPLEGNPGIWGGLAGKFKAQKLYNFGCFNCVLDLQPQELGSLDEKFCWEHMPSFRPNYVAACPWPITACLSLLPNFYEQSFGCAKHAFSGPPGTAGLPSYLFSRLKLQVGGALDEPGQAILSLTGSNPNLGATSHDWDIFRTKMT